MRFCCLHTRFAVFRWIEELMAMSYAAFGAAGLATFRQYRHWRGMACKLMSSHHNVPTLSSSHQRLPHGLAAPARESLSQFAYMALCRPATISTTALYLNTALACEMLSHISDVWIDIFINGLTVLYFVLALFLRVCHVYQKTSVKANVPWNVLRENATLLQTKKQVVVGNYLQTFVHTLVVVTHVTRMFVKNNVRAVGDAALCD